MNIVYEYVVVGTDVFGEATEILQAPTTVVFDVDADLEDNIRVQWARAHPEADMAKVTVMVRPFDADQVMYDL